MDKKSNNANDKKILSPLKNLEAQKKSVSLQVNSMEKDNPELVVDADKNKWVVKLLIALICLVVVGTGLYFILPSTTTPIEIEIDLQISDTSIDFINVESGESQENIKLMPGDPFLINYKVSCLDDDEIVGEEVFIRVKFYSIIDGVAYNNFLSIDTSTSTWLEDWTVGADGYIYYAETLGENEFYDATNRLMISKTVGNEFQGKQVTICILVECLQAGEGAYQAIESEWETAPILWKNHWKEVVR